MSNYLPSDEDALTFAVMLQAGLPASEAILYFVDGSDPLEVARILQLWLRSRAVKQATLQLMKTPWQDMTLHERMTYALNLHYSALAHYLYSHHFTDASPLEKAKLDTARAAIEAKLAGTAGQTDALSRFFEDLQTGRVKLGVTAPLLN